MATDPFAFTEEDCNDLIPEIVLDSESDEEFLWVYPPGYNLLFKQSCQAIPQEKGHWLLCRRPQKRERRSSSRERKEEVPTNWQVVMTRIFAIAGIIVFIIFLLSTIWHLLFTKVEGKYQKASVTSWPPAKRLQERGETCQEDGPPVPL